MKHDSLSIIAICRRNVIKQDSLSVIAVCHRHRVWLCICAVESFLAMDLWNTLPYPGIGPRIGSDDQNNSSKNTQVLQI